MMKFLEIAAILLLVLVGLGVSAFLYKRRQLDQNKTSKKRPKGAAGKSAVGSNGNGTNNTKEQQSRQQGKDKGGAKTGRQRLVSSSSEGKSQQSKFSSTSGKAPAYANPWLASTLKGPTSSILDLDCGANDKLITSCSEDDSRARNETKRRSPASSTSSSSSSTSSGCSKRRNKKGKPPPATPPPPNLSTQPSSTTRRKSSPALTTSPVVPPKTINSRSGSVVKALVAVKRPVQFVVPRPVAVIAPKPEKMLCLTPAVQQQQQQTTMTPVPAVVPVMAVAAHRHANQPTHNNNNRRSPFIKPAYQKQHQHQMPHDPQSVGHLNVLNNIYRGQPVGGGVVYQLLRNYILDVGQQILHCFPIEVYGMPGLVYVPERNNPVGMYGSSCKPPSPPLPSAPVEEDERLPECCRCHKLFSAPVSTVTAPATTTTINTSPPAAPKKRRGGRRSAVAAHPNSNIPVAVVAPVSVVPPPPPPEAPLTPPADPCVYHWGKLHTAHRECEQKLYTCCFQTKESVGCTVGESHVRRGRLDGYLHGFVKTRPTPTAPFDGNYGVCALDCEMCYTETGLQVARVTLLRLDGEVLYETYVKPDSPIVDYNTRFSGLTAKDLDGAFRTLKDVQIDLLALLNADTILIGHGLENDLCALRLLHHTLLDTSVLFPHSYGLPYRRSLRSLASLYLYREIQTSEKGHDSFEDAKACMDLVMWRLRKDVMRDL